MKFQFDVRAQNGLVTFSNPIVVSGPWPGYTTTSSEWNYKFFVVTYWSVYQNCRREGPFVQCYCGIIRHRRSLLFLFHYKMRRVLVSVQVRIIFWIVGCQKVIVLPVFEITIDGCFLIHRESIVAGISFGCSCSRFIDLVDMKLDLESLFYETVAQYMVYMAMRVQAFLRWAHYLQ